MRFFLVLFFSLLSVQALAFNVDDSTIVVQGEITEQNGAIFRDLILKRQEGSVVKILIDSQGGDIISTFEMISAMSLFKTQCYAKKAQSAGFHLFQACDTRIIGPESEMMVHFSYLRSPEGGSFSREDLLSTFMILSYYDGFFLGNIARRTGIPLQQLFNIISKEKNWFIKPIEAKALRMADTVADLK